MFVKLRALRSDQRGGTAIEYGLIVAVIVIVMLVGLATLANRTTTMWNDVAANVTAA
jgi:pilus assembly protein Flp/PilA